MNWLLWLGVVVPRAQAGWVLDDYRSFRDGGCDPDAEGIHSPVVLRVLRSTPLAEAGEDFPDEDLHKLFEADGGWYRPNARREAQLKPDDALCVAKIRAWEDQQRQMHCIEHEDQAVVTGNIEFYSWHRMDMGLGELHRYMQGMIPDERPKQSACTVSQNRRASLGGRWVEWSLDYRVVRNPSVAELKETYRRLFPDDEGGQVNSAFIDLMTQWERNRTPVHRLKWSSEQLEGNPGDDEPFRRTDVGICWGTGPFMDTSWFCLEAGTF